MSVVYDSNESPTLAQMSQRAIRLYQETYLDKVQPKMEQITALIDRADAENFRSTDIPLGDHGRNGLKYFDTKRAQIVAGVLAETLPEAFAGETLDILDVGCGFGDYMAVLRALGHNVVGTCGGADYYLEHYRFVHDLLGLDIRYEDVLSAWSFDDASFDYVLSVQMITLPSVILHTHRVIPQMQRSCRTGGRVILVPHCWYFVMAGTGAAAAA